MPSTYYSAVASVLEGGAIFKLYYPNYSTFLGINQSLPKAPANDRYTESAEEVKYSFTEIGKGLPADITATIISEMAVN